MAENTPSVPPRVFEHDARKDWGRSVLLVEIPDKRTFLFEDGAERSFRPDYWHKMEVVEITGPEAWRVDKLARRNQTPAPGSSRKSKLPPKKPDITFAQQVAHFVALYPVGFEDEKYVRTERGESGSKSAKILKDAALERAEEVLSEANLEALIEAGDYSSVHQLAYEFFANTKNTTQKSEATKFRSLPPQTHLEFATALRDLLYSDKPYGLRFDTFVSALEGEENPTWPIVTLLPALIFPQDHIFVKPTFMKKQALILDIDPKYDTAPNSTTYAQFQKAALAARELLREAGQRPRDLWDVYTFIWKTLSPKAIKAATGA